MALMFTDQRVFWTLFGIGLALFLLHGPVVGPGNYNGLRLIVSPILSSALAATALILWPYKPYRGSWAQISSMTDRNEQDADARRLDELFASREARRFVLKTMVKIVAVLLIAMGCVTAIHWRSMTWSLISPWFGQGVIGGTIGAYIALKTELLNWTFNQWANELNHHGQ